MHLYIDSRDVGVLLDSYSTNRLSIRRWNVRGTRYVPSRELTSVYQLAESMDRAIPLGYKISVRFRGDLYFQIDENGIAGTSCFQVYQLFNDAGKLTYRDYGYKILSWMKTRWGIGLPLLWRNQKLMTPGKTSIG